MLGSFEYLCLTLFVSGFLYELMQSLMHRLNTHAMIYFIPKVFFLSLLLSGDFQNLYNVCCGRGSLRVWTHRERQRELQATKLSLVATTHAWNYKKKIVAWKILSFVARVLWVHFLRFPLILRKDSLTRHDKRQFCHLSLALSLPVRSHP